MDEHEGARREMIQTIRQGVKLARDSIKTNDDMARAYESAHPTLVRMPAEELAEYERALREVAESDVRLADAIRAAIDSR